MTTYRNSRSISVLVLYLGYSLYRRVGGTQSLFGHFGEEKNSVLLPGFEPRTVRLVA
jgi:hypothetical protein